MALDITINTAKGITITSSNGGWYFMGRGQKNFSWDTFNKMFYFNRTMGTNPSYDYVLKYDDITTYNGVAAVPAFTVLLAAIRAELDAEV